MAEDRTVITTISFQAANLESVTADSTSLLDLLNQLEQKAQSVGQSFAGISSGGLSDLSSQIDTTSSSLDTLASVGTTASDSLQNLTGGDASAGLADLGASSDNTAGSLETLGAAGMDASASLQGISGGEAAAGLTEIGSAALTLGGDLDTADQSVSTLASTLQGGDFSSLGSDIDSAASALSSLSANAGGLTEIGSEAQTAASGLGDLATSATEAGSNLADEGSAARDAGHGNEEGGEGARHHGEAQTGLGAAAGTATGFLSAQIGVSGEVGNTAKEAYHALSEMASGEGEASAGAETAAAAILAMGTAIAAISVEGFVELGDSVHELGEQTGLSTNLIQGLGYAEETIGNSAGDADAALARFSRTMGQANDAIQNGGAVSKTFSQGIESLGLSVEDIVKMSPDEAFRAIDDAFSKLPEDANKATIAFDLFGRQGMGMIGVLGQGNEALDTGSAKVSQYGASVASAWPEIQKFHAAHADLTTAMQGFEVTVGGAVLPVLTSFVQEVAQGASDLHDFNTELSDLGGHGPGQFSFLSVLGDLAKGVAPGLNFAAAEQAHLNDEVQRGNDLAAQQAQFRKDHPAHQGNDPNITFTGDDGQQTVVQGANLAAASLDKETGAANGVFTSIRGIVNASFEAASAAAVWSQITAPTPAQIAAQQLTTDIELASGAYDAAKIAQDKLFGGPTTQQTQGDVQLALLKGELAGYQEQLQSLKPGQAGYADAQQNIANLTAHLIPQQQAANAAVDGSVAAYKGLYAALQSGAITQDQFNTKVDQLARSAGSAVPAFTPLQQSVRDTAAAQDAARQSTDALEASVEGLDRGFIPAGTHLAAFAGSAEDLSGALDPLGGHFLDAGQGATTASTDIQAVGSAASTVGGALDESGQRVQGWGDDVLHSSEASSTTMTSAGATISIALTDTGGHLDTSKSNFLDWHKGSSQAATETASDTQTASTGIQGALTTTDGALSSSVSNFSDWQRGGSTAVDNLATSVRLGLEQLDSAASAESVAIGVDIAAGMAAGIAAGSGAVAAAAAGAVDNAVAAAKAAGQISSPSRRTWQEIGVPLMDGITGAVLDETSGLAAAISASVQGAIGVGVSELVNAPGELGNMPGELRSSGGGFGAGVGGKPSTALADALTKHADSTAKHTDALAKHSAAISTSSGSGGSDPAVALTSLAAAADRAATSLDRMATSAGGAGGDHGKLTSPSSPSDVLSTSVGKATGSQAHSKAGDSIAALSELIGIPSPQELVSIGSAMVDSISQGAQDAGSTLTSTVSDLFQSGVVVPFVSDATTLGEAAVSGIANGWEAGSPQLSELAAATGSDVAAAFATRAGFGGELASTATKTGWEAGSPQLAELTGTSGSEAGKKWADAFSSQANQAIQSAQSAASSGGGGSGSGSGGGGGSGGGAGAPAGGGAYSPSQGGIIYGSTGGTAVGTHLSEIEQADWALTLGAMAERMPVFVSVKIGDAPVEAIWARAASHAMTTRVQSGG